MVLHATDSATAQTRYTFTGQFVRASALFARRALEIEDGGFTFESLPEDLRMEHRALVSTSIMQCAFALETEAHEICVHGPGSHLGSGRIDEAGLKLLLPLADVIDGQQTLRRYELILHLLGKPALSRGSEPYQSVALMVRLRNALVHYKSLWGPEMSDDRLFAAIEGLGLKEPPFTPANMNFFPHRCLSAACARWSVSSTVAFLDHIYGLLGVESRFEHERKSLLA